VDGGEFGVGAPALGDKRAGTSLTLGSEPPILNSVSGHLLSGINVQVHP
jgi:hypothetical protein